MEGCLKIHGNYLTISQSEGRAVKDIGHRKGKRYIPQSKLN